MQSLQVNAGLRHTLTEREKEEKKQTEKLHKPHNTQKLILKAALENALEVQVLEPQVAFGCCKLSTAFNAIPNSRKTLRFIFLAVLRLLHCKRKSPLIPCGSTILAAKLNARLFLPTPDTGVIRDRPTVMPGQSPSNSSTKSTERKNILKAYGASWIFSHAILCTLISVTVN